MKEVAVETLRQLGGNKFIAMTGIKNLIHYNLTLQMQLPGIANTKAKYLAIEYKPESDTYDMIFFRVGKDGKEIIAHHTGVYNDTLGQIFTSETGLETKL